MPEHVCPIISSAVRYGESPALILSSEQITYSQFSALVDTAAAAMQSEGWGEGDRIGLVMPNCGEYVVLLAAMFRLGIIACPLNTRLPVQALRQEIEQIRCRAVITDRPFAIDAGCAAVVNITDLAADEAVTTQTQSGVHFDQPATVLYTSGSSGTPRAAMHSYANHYYNASGSNENIPFEPGDRWLLSLPLYHVGGIGILFRAWLGAGAVVIPDRTESLAAAIGKYEITHLSLVSTQLHRLITQERNFSMSHLKHILLGGGAMPRSLIEAAVSAGLPIHTSYGLTEMASQVTTTALADIPNKLHTAGRLLPHRQIKVTREGDILVRGETLFAGYVLGESVASATDADGWFLTGDVGYCDAAGYLIVSGRRDAMFISGGENIHPEEIEAVLLSLPGISQAIVVPRLHPEYGFRPVAFIQAQTERVRAGEIKQALREILPGYKIPDRILPWPEDSGQGFKPDRTFFIELAAELVDFTS